LTCTVLEYVQTMKHLVLAPEAPADWAPFVAVDEFERVGTFCEVQNWQQYTDMLTQRATAVDSFESTVLQISEVRDLVYFEIEEPHFRGENVNVVNSMTAFEFNTDGKIRHLDVYLQQMR
jgi:hypothetical protein